MTDKDKTPSIFSQNSPPPVVAPVPVCKLGERCHVNGKGLTMFGTKFPSALVQRLASSSIQLTGPNFNDRTKPDLRVASGVLIAPEVALFAAHSVNQGFSAGDIHPLMCFECSTTTAPPGMFSQYRGGWPACTPLASTFQAVEVKTLEIDSAQDLDYALIRIKWTNAPGNVVKLPRVPVFPKMGTNLTNELLLIGHPDEFSTNQGEPTQACAFKLFKESGPNPQTGKGDVYGYGEFNFTRGAGFSGGGVFNEQGELVGILSGTAGNTIPGLTSKHFAFLKLNRIHTNTENDPRRGRISAYLKTGNPLLLSGHPLANPKVPDPPSVTTFTT